VRQGRINYDTVGKATFGKIRWFKLQGVYFQILVMNPSAHATIHLYLRFLTLQAPPPFLCFHHLRLISCNLPVSANFRTPRLRVLLYQASETKTILDLPYPSDMISPTRNIFWTRKVFNMSVWEKDMASTLPKTRNNVLTQFHFARYRAKKFCSKAMQALCVPTVSHKIHDHYFHKKYRARSLLWPTVLKSLS